MQATKFPDETEVKFKNFRKTVTHPIYVVADFECMLQQPPIPQPTTDAGTQHHAPVSISNNYFIAQRIVKNSYFTILFMNAAIDIVTHVTVQHILSGYKSWTRAQTLRVRLRHCNGL